jgi:hypothetical protein
MFRLKALSSALTFNVRTAPPARLPHSSQFSTSSWLAKMLSTGSCYCRAITYEVSLNSADDARTSICHCKNCKVCTPPHLPLPLPPGHRHLPIPLAITHPQRYRNSPAATLALRPRSQSQPSRSNRAGNTSKYTKQTTGRAWSCTANSVTPAAQDYWNMVYVIRLRPPNLSLACPYVNIGILSQYRTRITNMVVMRTGQRWRLRLHILRDTRQPGRSTTEGRILLQEEGQLDARDSRYSLRLVLLSGLQIYNYRLSFLLIEP